MKFRTVFPAVTTLAALGDQCFVFTMRRDTTPSSFERATVDHPRQTPCKPENQKELMLRFTIQQFFRWSSNLGTSYGR
jgi:hypothetical protein